MRTFRVRHGEISREFRALGHAQAAQLGASEYWRDFLVSGNVVEVVVTDLADDSTITYLVRVETAPRFIPERKP